MTRESQAASLDPQQALVLEALRRAHGEIVTYGQLRDAGIEYPATVVSELELAGLPVERRLDGIAAAQLSLVRWLGGQDPDRAAPNRSAAREHGRALAHDLGRVVELLVSQAARRIPRRADQALAWLGERAFATTALAGLLLAAILITAFSGSRPSTGNASRAAGRQASRTASFSVSQAHRRRSSRHRAWPSPAPGEVSKAAEVSSSLGRSSSPDEASETASAAPQREGQASPHYEGADTASASTPASSPPLAASLEARGHALLESGEPQSAAPLFRGALAATHEDVASCLEPATEACLTYAYALYDLGRALRLDREPAGAVAILEQRARIDNQRPVVQSELELARRASTAPRKGPGLAPSSS